MTLFGYFRGVILFCSFVCSGGVEASDHTNWPDLADFQVVIGRPATEADVNAGKAVFVIRHGGVLAGRPLPIKLPQYAYHIDGETKKRTPCILIQAEEAAGRRLGGCRTLPDDSLLAGFIEEFQLIGTVKPQ